jgi:hypothetical protein
MRMHKIIDHLRARGAQYVGDAGDKIDSTEFTEHVFRNLVPSVRVREYRSGIIELLFVPEEMCAGSSGDKFHQMPDMDWVLKTIDERCEVMQHPKVT